jgi:membrane fusion protein, multidrug efflux system
MKNRHKCALLSLFLLSCCTKAPPPPAPHHLASTTQPLVQDVPIYVDYIGHMVAKTSVKVLSQVSGTIVAQYFEEGQKVKRGDLLLVIDPRPFQAALASAEATLAQTYATLRYDNERMIRYSPLVKQDFISQLNYDQYVTSVLVDEAVVAQNKASIETAQINLGYCYISAPMDSITSKLFVKTGNFVDVSAGTELMLLNQIQPILVDFDVPETDLLTIQEYQKQGMLKLIVYPDPAHKHAFEGELTLINNQINTSTGTVLLEGTLPNEENILWPGHFVDVRLILAEKKGALLLPNSAILIGQKGHYVYVVKSDSTVEARYVKVGQRYGDSLISIESGISSGEIIVTEGQLNLFPGVKVDIQPPQETPS